jgi:competence protein ComEA
MFTRAEKGYLALTLFFLAAGSGIKAYRHSLVKLGPFPSAASRPEDRSAPIPADSAAFDSTAPDSAAPGRTEDFHAAGGGAPLPESPGLASSGGALSEPGRATRSRGGSAAAKAGFTGKVDLNGADAAALARVKGIGEKTAQAIIEYRKAHGPFRELRDLLQVKGIGEKKLEKLSPFLIL